jgi:LPS-assembly protein
MIVRTLAVILLVGAALAANAAPASGQTSITVTAEGGSVTMVADRIEQIGRDNLVVATGNVEIVRGNARLLADRAELNRDTGDIVASGRVIFYDGDDQLAGERIDYNYRTGTGVVTNGQARTAPYYRLGGERMERLGEGLYGIRRGFFTTCEDDPPTWSFHARDSTADLEDSVHGTNASFWVKDLPLIPWLPGFYAAIRRERQTGFLFPVVGDSRFKGFFAQIPFFWAIADNQDALIIPGYMTERGPSVDATYRYVLAPHNRGTAGGVMVYEGKIEGDVRGSYGIRHYWDLTDRLSFTADVNGVSDDTFLGNYSQALQTRGTQYVPSNVFLTQRWSTFNLTGNLFWYQDLTQTRQVALQRLPQLFFDAAPQPIPGLPGFLYQFQTSAVNFVRDVGSEGGRLAVQPMVSRPIRIADVITLTPFAGAIITAYTKTATGSSEIVPGSREISDTRTRAGFRTVPEDVLVEETVSDTLVRPLAVVGADLTARASRVYQAGFGGIDAFMHVIEPRVGYTFIGGRDTEGVPQWTELDRIPPASLVSYSLINRLFSRTIAPPGMEGARMEVGRLTLAQGYDAKNPTTPFTPFFAELILSPTPMVYFRGDTTYDVYGGGFQTVTTNVTVVRPHVAASIGTSYNKLADLNYVQGSVTADITRYVTARVQTNWDAREGAFVENRYAMDVKFQCWGLTFEYVSRYQSDDEFRFSLNLLGIGGIGTSLGSF